MFYSKVKVFISPKAIKKYCIILLLGLSSGLPLAALSSTLQAWYTTAHISLTNIGLLALISNAYFFKFLWAPVCDHIKLPWGRRRGWIICCHLCIITMLFIISPLSPLTTPLLIAIIAGICAITSATLDIAINAYQTEILKPNERGFGATCYVFGYRIGMLISGGLSLIIADHFGWMLAYRFMACCMLPGLFICYLVDEPNIQSQKYNLLSTTKHAILDLLHKPCWFQLLMFILLYKISESFIATSGASMINTFLIREMHFNLTQIGIVNKMFSFAGTIVGMIAGGILLTKMRLHIALLLFGIIQICGNLSFAIISIMPADLHYLAIVILIESIANGLVTAGLITLIMGICNTQYCAFQFALLSAIAAVGRTLFSPLAGWIAANFGWHIYFIIGVILAFPGLFYIKQEFNFYHNQHEETCMK